MSDVNCFPGALFGCLIDAWCFSSKQACMNSGVHDVAFDNGVTSVESHSSQHTDAPREIIDVDVPAKVSMNTVILGRCLID
jgi:hypothetical protein